MSPTMSSYLNSIHKQFAYYKGLGEKTFAQLDDENLTWQPGPESNSIATIVKHIHGNMLSRFTDFLTDDGEKEWRNRDGEFENDLDTRDLLIEKWEEGWKTVFDAISSLTENDLERMIYIRNMGHTVIEALNRQLAHYAYHVGQIVYLGKMIRDDAWNSLSIPKGESKAYNAEKFAQPKRKKHFTDEQ